MVLAGTGAVLLPAVASAHSASHTLKFTAVTVKSTKFTSTTFGNQETDVNSTGKTIGFDDVYITVTGSTATGRKIMKEASGTLKNITLETGGKSPLLVFDDADLEQAVKWSHAGVMSNMGQVCSAVSQFAPICLPPLIGLRIGRGTAAFFART